MTWITTIPEAKATGALAEAYTHIREQNGSVSNITEAASINPPVMRALANLLYALRGPHCALGKRRQEMIAVLRRHSIAARTERPFTERLSVS